MINWINFLHIYQPPAQNEFIFHQVARESYFEIAKFFDEFDGLRLTMNLSGSLLEQLVAYRYDKLLDDFRRAALNGELELVGSAMYHPLLPLLPPAEMERQILLDERIKQRLFGSGYARRGFYLPEMAYSREAAEVVDRLGFSWIILDEIAGSGQLGSSDAGRVYRLAGLKLKVVLRDRTVSDSFVPSTLGALAAAGTERTVVTATDGELYGHRHRDFYGQTKAAFENGNIRSQQVSEFVAAAGEDLPEISPVSSSWETRPEDLAAGMPYPYWQEPGNEIQRQLRDFAVFAAQEIEKYPQDSGYPIARGLLDKGFSSCHLWAASGRQSSVWRETIWNPDTVERGNNFLISALRSLAVLPLPLRLEAEERAAAITRLLWSLHWNKFYGV